MCIVVDSGCLTQSVTVEDVILTLEDVLLDDAVVRLVNGEDKSSDRVTTVHSLRGITIDARLHDIHTAELIGCSLTNGRTDSIEDRFVHDELDAPERTFPVDISCIIVVDTGAVE